MDILQKYHRWVVTILFLTYFLNGLIYIPRQSITYDEADHFNYAVRFVKGHPEKVKPFDDASTMPMSALNTAPRAVEQIFNRHLKKSNWGYDDIIHGRYVTLIISLLIGLYVYLWAKDLFGKPASLFSLLLFVFCPNLSAHAGLVTTDIYSTLFTIAPLYHFWKYYQQRSMQQFILFAVAVALAELSKQSLTFLYPIFFLLVIARTVYEKNLRSLFSIAALRKFVLFLCIQLFILNVGFQFKDFGTPLNNYSFRSGFFQRLQYNFRVMGNLPLPIPVPYLQGLDLTKKIDEIGPGHPESSAKVYLLGEVREGKGFPYYYFVVLFFKMPIPLLLSFFISLFILFRSKRDENSWNATVLLLPVIFFLIYFDFFYNSQVGIRHILMILPLMHVFSGYFFRTILNRKRGLLLGGLLAIYSITSFYFYFPHLIPYTNEFIWSKKLAYKKIADSNLDYGQAAHLLDGYIKEAQGTYAPQVPTNGTFIIRVADLVGVEQENRYSWLHNNYQPSGHLAFTYLIFHVSKESLMQKNLLPK